MKETEYRSEKSRQRSNIDVETLARERFQRGQLSKASGLYALTRSSYSGLLALGTADGVVLLDGERAERLTQYPPALEAEWTCVLFDDATNPHVVLAANRDRHIYVYDTRQHLPASKVSMEMDTIDQLHDIQLYPFRNGKYASFSTRPKKTTHISASIVLCMDTNVVSPHQLFVGTEDGSLFCVDWRQQRVNMFARDASGDGRASGLWTSAVSIEDKGSSVRIATGSDGKDGEPVVSVWNAKAKHDLLDSHNHDTGICRHVFRDHDDTIVALAWNRGETMHTRPRDVHPGIENEDHDDAGIETAVLASLSIDGRLVIRCLPSVHNKKASP